MARMADYLNFELNVEALADRLRVTVGDSPVGSVSADVTNPFATDEIARIIGVMEGSIQTTRAQRSQAARAFGEKLFNTVFPGEIFAAYLASQERAGEAGLRIKLGLETSGALQDIPWELLRDPRGDYLALSRQTPVIRHPRLLTVRPIAEITLPLRVLVMIASPTDQQPLNVEAEWRALEDATQELRNRGLLELERLDDAQLVTLQRKLRESVPYHIFHFIGHAAFDDSSQTGMLAFEDPRTLRSVPVSGEALARELSEESSIRLVVLNACQAARQNLKDPFAGIASSIVARGIPAVVAMQFAISDDASRTFSQEFYRALSEGYPIEAAMSEARRTISSTLDNLEWATPVLYLRAPTGMLFPKARSETAVSTGGIRELLRSPGCLLRGLLVAVALIAIGVLLRSIFPPRPPGPASTPTPPIEARDVDLTITSLRFLPPNPAPGQRVAVSMVLRNSGSTDSGPFKWAWFIDAPQTSQKPTLEGSVDNIGPGMSRIVAQDFFFPRWGTYVTTAWVNYDSSIPEKSFFNNLRVSPPVNVTAPLSVDFSRLPDGTPLLESRDLKGDEFGAWGFRLGANSGSGCDGAIVRVSAEGEANRLTTGLPGSTDQCTDLPINFDFDNPVGGAEIEFFATTAGTYTVDLIDGNGKLIDASTVTADASSTSTISAPASGEALATVRKVVFSGPGKAQVAIQRATFSLPASP
jgi:hypothetical protein